MLDRRQESAAPQERHPAAGHGSRLCHHARGDRGRAGPLPGADGFRAAHRSARAAQEVAARLGRRCARYDEVALERQALSDEPAARAFVVEQLGELAGASGEAARLRATLRAYLARNHNASAASAALGVADRTVTQRLRACEERLGASIASRATELGVALRWGAVLGVFEPGAPQP